MAGRRGEWLAVLCGAWGAFALALWSPADSTRADPGLALLVSQTMLEEQTAWIGDRMAEDPKADHRVQVGGVYYGWGVPILSMPAVLVARELGYDMHRPADDEALQEVLSAACCGALFVLVWLLARTWVGMAPAAVITSITVFGSPLLSTLATGLWNSAYATVLLTGALLWLVRRPGRGLLTPLALVAVAGLCRPTAGFFALGLSAMLARRGRWWQAIAAALGILTAAAVLWFAGLDQVLYYYTPRKLLAAGAEPLVGLAGALLSPGRGLLVYCPFIAVVLAGVALERQVLRQPVAVLAVTWIGAQLLATAWRPRWWGGHSFGPRYFTEIMPAVAVLAALVWQATGSEPRRRRVLAACYLASGVVAIGLHLGVGLFNDWSQRWNVEPDIDRHAELLWDWRYPQFLATESRHEDRLLDFERRRRRAYVLGDRITPGSDQAAFLGWSPPEAEGESEWRWTRRRRASIYLQAAAEPPGLCALELVAGVQGHQSLTLGLAGATLGHLELHGFEPRRHLFPFSCSTLRGEVEIAFELPRASSSAGDERMLGLAMRSLGLHRLEVGGAVDWRQDLFFGGGFSVAEQGWRWTDGGEARVWLPAAESARAIEIEAWALGRQQVGLEHDGVDLGVRVFDGPEPVTRRWLLSPAPSPRLLELRLRLSDPTSPPGDPRRLGLAVVSLRAVAGETP